MNENPHFVKAVDAQRRAADPARSAMVSANAGSGKTRVLTDRVARLLLSGAEPERILCITYTKAAAAEMADRLFKLLGKWALASDDDLSEKLNALEGTTTQARAPEDLAQARQLFAKALETPGGLKIQTIHSFCESVLKRFPLEAGAPPGFTVLEDKEAAAFAEDAAFQAAQDDETDRDAHVACARLGARFGAARAQELIIRTLTSRQSLIRALERSGDWRTLKRACLDAFDLTAGDQSLQPEMVKSAFIDQLDLSMIDRARAAFEESGGNPKKWFVAPLDIFLSTENISDQWQALRAVFLKSDGQARDAIGTKKTDAIDAAVRPYCEGLSDAFAAAQKKITALANYHDTAALLTILEKALAIYARRKFSKAVLDFDDIILTARRLFMDREKNAWVMYKLDHGLEHILLDEAQDTSPSQWDIIEAPLDEFLSGVNAHADRRKAEAPSRSFFAVGDEKQSIYSFQGADAELFAEKQQYLGAKIAATTPYESVPLQLSFRTTTPVLQFVDALFQRPAAFEGVSSDGAITHTVNRTGEAGQVEVWPLVPRPEKQILRAWDAPLDSEVSDAPKARLTGHIADTISKWLGVEPLQSQDRPIRAGDIVILVQSRSDLFHGMISALAERGVPVAGADKLKLLEDPAVEDLMSYARAVATPGDDLSLAEILKSPFFGYDDEKLFHLAYGREGSLWNVLTAREDLSKDADAIRQARRVAQRDGPYAFFSHLLDQDAYHGASSGRRRLYGRLSEASREPINEFLRLVLEFENASPRSLRAFIAWISETADEIKRDLEQGSDAVRVMTVHGAKGLEGEIVFLLDAHRRPDAKKLGPLFWTSSKDGAARSISLPMLSPSKNDDGEAAAAARDAARQDDFNEYRRLLYVAATRARDRLYICGVEAGNEKNPGEKPDAEKSWHQLSLDAMQEISATECVKHGAWAGDCYVLNCPQTKAADEKKSAKTIPPTEQPTWLFENAKPETARRRLAPSQLADKFESAAQNTTTLTPAFSPLRPIDAARRGRILHRLLELLPALPPSQRTSAADRLLSLHAGDIAEDERARWREEVLTVLNIPAFADAFGPQARAEVSISGVLPQLKRPSDAVAPIISGQIDRLAILDDRILVIDYKTNRPPPKRVEDVPHAYLAQMAAYRALVRNLYPDKPVELALLWTFEARLTPLPDSLLDHAFAHLSPNGLNL